MILIGVSACKSVVVVVPPGAPFLASWHADGVQTYVKQHEGGSFIGNE